MNEHGPNDGLESLLGETMRVRTDSAPDAAGLLDRVTAGAARKAKARRRYAVGGSVALVTAVAVSVSLLTAQAPKRDQSQGSPTASGTSASAAGMPGGEAAWDFHGLEVEIPAAWGVNVTQCGEPTANTVLVDEGAIAACLMENPPVVDYAQFKPSVGLVSLPGSHPVTVSGQPGTLGTEKLRDGRTHAVLILPGLDAAIEVETHSAALEAAIIGSAQVVAKDPDGCASQVSSLHPSGPAQRAGAADELVPGTPTTAVICHYSNDYLGHSTLITGAKLTELTSMLNGLQPGLKRSGAMDSSICSSGEEEGYIVRFDYSDGPPLDIYIHTYSCDHLGADSGSRTGGLTETFGGNFLMKIDNPHFGGAVTGDLS